MLEAVADMKFTCIATCQNYGNLKRHGDPRATDILNLMVNNPSLRVAYIDEVNERDIENGQRVYYSVLVKAVDNLEQEIYRIKLPGPAKIGEGKPENPNHAIIFTRGEALQAIDMDQDNYLEEAFEMLNLLEDFNEDHGVHPPPTLGFREYICTGCVSSFGWMSNEETSFATNGRRVLTRPLKCHFQYGHQDVFDRVLHITGGGINKASCDMSDDIFDGYSSKLRPGGATGRGYVAQHKTLIENFKMYSRSIFIQAFIFLHNLVYYQLYGTPYNSFLIAYMWVLLFSWIFPPFIFNPSGLECQQIVKEWGDWVRWMRQIGAPNNIWEFWWEEEKEFLKHKGLIGRLWMIFISMRFYMFDISVMHYVQAGQIRHIPSDGEEAAWILVGQLVAYWMAFSSTIGHELYFVPVLLVLLFCYVLLLGPVKEGIYACAVAVMPSVWGTVLILQACRPICEYISIWDYVKKLSKGFDLIVGKFIFGAVTLLAWFPFVSKFQTRLLFNQATRRGMEIQRILAGARESSQ